MGIELVGTLPVSALNIGLGASTVAFTADVTKLTGDISGLTGAIETQIQFSADFPPNLPGFAAAFVVALNPANLLAAFAPAAWVSLTADAKVDLLARLGLVDAQVELVAPVVADLNLGADASDLQGWSYSGQAEGFGRTLEAETAQGFANTGPNDNIDALIIATNLFASWESFSLGFNTGESSNKDLGNTTDQQQLQSLGTLSGDDWNIGVKLILEPVRLILTALEQAKAALEAQLQVSIAVNLPDPGTIVDIGLSIDLEAALGGIEVQVDLDADISGIQVDIDATLAFIADINLLLEAGDLAFWRYTGPASGLGAALIPELEDGLPGTPDGPRAPIYGVAVASSNSAAWAAFGSIFRTA